MIYPNSGIEAYQRQIMETFYSLYLNQRDKLDSAYENLLQGMMLRRKLVFTLVLEESGLVEIVDKTRDRKTFGALFDFFQIKFKDLWRKLKTEKNKYR